MIAPLKICITGICGFVGSRLARGIADALPDARVSGIDNLSRPGSELNDAVLRAEGFEIHHGDIGRADDCAPLDGADWVIDAAAEASVLAGTGGAATGFRTLLDTNLVGTINLLERCKESGATFTLLSTSRVYSIGPLAALQVGAADRKFAPVAGAGLPGLSDRGVDETFLSEPPLSLYGSSKRCAEILALECGEAYGFPVWINRCGLMAGAGQFGRPDQGIVSYWLNSHLRREPLRYTGFDGLGHQVRDCLHPDDLVPLLIRQFKTEPCGERPRLMNLSGGAASAFSLRELTDWCDARFGAHPVASDPSPRPFDLPWVVLDSTLAARTWGWDPQIGLEQILDGVAGHAEANPDWLEISSPRPATTPPPATEA